MALCQNGENSILVLVTNRHVVVNAIRGKFWLTKKDASGDAPIYGQHHEFELDGFSSRWFYHKSLDLAVLPITPYLQQAKEQGHEYFFRHLGVDLMPTKEELADLPAMLDVVLVGYPNGIWDEQNNQPLLRKGITATHPELDYNGKPEFVIDAACFNGSSGSPVFLVELGKTISRSKGMVIGPSRIKFLGVLYAGPIHLATGEVKTVEIGHKSIAITGIPQNLGYVIAARAMRDFEPILHYVGTKGSTPHRNAPCPCEGGKRYKECCGSVV
jgi:hypothetical protein